MSHIEDVVRLKDLLAGSTFSSEHVECRDIVDTLNAAPWLLTVAGQFQSGDSEILEDWLYQIEEEYGESGADPNDQAITKCLRRMLSAEHPDLFQEE